MLTRVKTNKVIFRHTCPSCLPTNSVTLKGCYRERERERGTQRGAAHLLLLLLLLVVFVSVIISYDSRRDCRLSHTQVMFDCCHGSLLLTRTTYFLPPLLPLLLVLLSLLVFSTCSSDSRSSSSGSSRSSSRVCRLREGVV